MARHVWLVWILGLVLCVAVPKASVSRAQQVTPAEQKSAAAPIRNTAQEPAPDGSQAARTNEPSTINILEASEDPDPLISWLDVAFNYFAFLLPLIAAGFAYVLGVRQWMRTYFTTEWGALLRFLFAHCQYMDPDRTSRYKEAFVGDQAREYEIVARLCMAYLDDMNHKKYGGERLMKQWYRGSIELLAGRHRDWLEDNRDSYSPAFYAFVVTQLREKADAHTRG